MDAVADWPKDSWTLALFPVKDHMDRLERLGKVRGAPRTHPINGQLA
jgi:hypothetical protein